MARKHWMFVTVALVTLAMDQGSKAWIRTLDLGSELTWIPGLLTTVHVENPGGVLGVLGSLPVGAKIGIFGFAGVGMAAISWLWLRRSPPEALVGPAALGLLIGGALGNGLDRALRGTVTDFLVVGSALFDPLFARLPWTDTTPAFNLADGFLGVGIVLLCLLAARSLWLGQAEAEAA